MRNDRGGKSKMKKAMEKQQEVGEGLEETSGDDETAGGKDDMLRQSVAEGAAGEEETESAKEATDTIDDNPVGYEVTTDFPMEITEYTSEQNTDLTPSAESEDEEDHGKLLRQLRNIKIYGIGTAYRGNLDQVIRAIKFFLQVLEAVRVRKPVISGEIHNKPGHDGSVRGPHSTLRHYICYEKKRWVLFESWHVFPKGAEYFISRLGEFNRWQIPVSVGENGSLVVETWTRQQTMK